MPQHRFFAGSFDGRRDGYRSPQSPLTVEDGHGHSGDLEVPFSPVERNTLLSDGPPALTDF